MSHQLSDDRYRRFQELLSRRAGLSYPESRRADLGHGLTRALQATGLHSLDALYAAAHTDPQVWEAIIAHLTIGETYFFRHAAQFEVLRQQLLPELIAKRAHTRMLRIWSAGCATGEEPYSLAMLLHELLPAPEAWHITILATDINAQFLERARAALYGEWSFREDALAWRERYFTPEQGRWRLRPEIRRMVTFAPLNLAEPSYPSLTTGTGALDLIVCRNVTIYFDEATTRQIAERFYRALLPGGWLMVGHAEPHATHYHQFQVRNFPDAILYRKPPDAVGFAVPRAERRADPPQPAPLQTPRAASRATEVRHSALAQPTRPAMSEQPSPDHSQSLWGEMTQAIQRDDQPAIARLRSALIRSGASQEAVLLRIARIAAARENWASAQQECERALALNALSVTAHLLLAQIYHAQQQLDAALDAYRRVLYLDPAVIVALVGIAQVWSSLGRAPEAARSWRAAGQQLALLPSHAVIPGTDEIAAGRLLAMVQEQIQTGAPVAARIVSIRFEEGRSTR